jgi:hypothetical protein
VGVSVTDLLGVSVAVDVGVSVGVFVAVAGASTFGTIVLVAVGVRKVGVRVGVNLCVGVSVFVGLDLFDPDRVEIGLRGLPPLDPSEVVATGAGGNGGE